jgi:hypothetical protein
MYLIHTPSDVRELEGLDISFEIFPFSEDRIWPMVVTFEREEDIAEALRYGIITKQHS